MNRLLPCLLLCGLSAFGRTAPTNQIVGLAWNASADSMVVGYNLYWGTNSGIYTTVTNAGNHTNVTVRVPLTRCFFTATCYNSSGVQSPFSSQISFSGWGTVVAFTNATTNIVQTASNPGGPWKAAAWQSWVQTNPPGAMYCRLVNSNPVVPAAQAHGAMALVTPNVIPALPNIAFNRYRVPLP